MINLIYIFEDWYLGLCCIVLRFVLVLYLGLC